MKKNILSLAALLIASATFVACSSDDNIIEEQPVQPTEQVYTMTVNASKGGDAADSRALSLSGSTLNATWTAGDEVEVWTSDGTTTKYGTLTAETGGASTTLKGNLSTLPGNGESLLLKYLSPTYATQDGTLTGSDTSIDKVCDYAEAKVTVASVADGNITTTAASFINQQAIVKFTLLKQADNSDLEIPAATSFTVSDGSSNFTVIPASATNELFVAIPATNTVNLSTTIDGIPYSYNKTEAGLKAGNYYEISVKMARGTVDLSNLTKNTTLLNGDVLTGTLDVEYYPVKISIADGATVTLNGVTINGTNSSSCYWAGINCEGDATIVLMGENTVKGFYDNYPGIHVPSGKTLTIQGTGSLTASSNGHGAGIGGGLLTGSSAKIDCGNIVIEGGTITATGGTNAAGIGGGSGSACGTITIKNSVTKVTATKGENATNSIGAGGNGGTVGTVIIGSKEGAITESPYTYQP